MPELPEVEVTRQGVESHILKKTVTNVEIRTPSLRVAIPSLSLNRLIGQTLNQIERRGKYLLFHFQTGVMLVHLGMSGHLKIVTDNAPAQKHDHIDWQFQSTILRLNDPRRFGSVQWHDYTEGSVFKHASLIRLGIEPLSTPFNAAYLASHCQTIKQPIKQCLLEGKVVVGVGNIYCSESLFRAKIHPQTPTNQLSLKHYKDLVVAIKTTLKNAIKAGGSSLKDFINPNGQQGYFQQQYFVYQREGEPCHTCHTEIQKIVQNQRATFFCPHCQPINVST